MLNFGANVKRNRLALKLTLNELSAISGVSRAMLSEIERDIKVPTIEIACKIADALDVNILELLDKKDNNRIKVIHKNERPVLTSEYTYKRFLLSPSLPFSLIEFEYCVIPQGKSTGPIMAHDPPIKEYLVVSSGTITLCTGQDEEAIVLTEGDSVAYQIFTEHQLINSGDGDATFYYICENRSK